MIITYSSRNDTVATTNMSIAAIPAALIAQEAAPGRRRPPSSSHHVLGDGGLADLDAELEQFAMDPRRTPERVGDVHLLNQIPSLAIH